MLQLFIVYLYLYQKKSAIVILWYPFNIWGVHYSQWWAIKVLDNQVGS